MTHRMPVLVEYHEELMVRLTTKSLDEIMRAIRAQFFQDVFAKRSRTPCHCLRPHAMPDELPCDTFGVDLGPSSHGQDGLVRGLGEYNTAMIDDPVDLGVCVAHSAGGGIGLGRRVELDARVLIRGGIGHARR